MTSNSDITGRAKIANRLGKSFSDARDIYTALGYKLTPTYQDYVAKYFRQDIARPCIDLPAIESWCVPPGITEGQDGETEFEQAWTQLAKNCNVYHYLARVDRLASLGRYAILMLGFDDARPLDQEVTKASQLLYLMPYSEANATIGKYEQDPKNKRYGLPTEYTVTRKSLGLGAGGVSSVRVHWSRVIHVAEDLLEDNVEGAPRLERILNRLDDLERIVGGSAEMFWRGGMPIRNWAIDKDYRPEVQELADMREQIEEIVHGLKRDIRTHGIEIQVPETPLGDPTGTVAVQIDFISAAMRIPKRILLGSERGELSSDQDERAWAKIIMERQRNYCEPVIVRQTVDRCIDVGVIPEPVTGEYGCDWQDMLAPSEKERVTIGATRAKAAADLMNAIGALDLIPPEVALDKVLALPQSDIDKIKEITDEMLRVEQAADNDVADAEHEIDDEVPVE
jgi:hypothetical protein